MNDFDRRKAQWIELQRHAAEIRDEALELGRTWAGFVPALHLVVMLQKLAAEQAPTFAH